MYDQTALSVCAAEAADQSEVGLAVGADGTLEGRTRGRGGDAGEELP